MEVRGCPHVRGVEKTGIARLWGGGRLELSFAAGRVRRVSRTGDRDASCHAAAIGEPPAPEEVERAAQCWRVCVSQARSANY